MRGNLSEEDDDSDRQPLLKMSKVNEDPFYSIREYGLCLRIFTSFTHFPDSDVKSQSDQIQIRYQKFLELVRTVDTATNAEFIELRKSELLLVTSIH